MSAKSPDYRTPGWYPDPKAPGGTRWWDGSEWSDHKNAVLAASPDELQPTGSMQPEPPQSDRAASLATRSRSQAMRAQSLGFRGVGFGVASVVLLLLPVSVAATWVVNLIAALLAIATGIFSVVMRRRAGTNATLGTIAIVLGAIGLIGLGAIGALLLS